MNRRGRSNGNHVQDEVANDGESVLLALPLSPSLTLMFEQCYGGPRAKGRMGAHKEPIPAHSLRREPEDPALR